MTAGEALHLCEAMACIGIAIASAEIFFVRDVLSDSGFLSWRLNRLMRPGLARQLERFGIGPALHYPNILFLIALRGIAALIVVVLVALQQDTRLLLALAAGCTLLTTYRAPHANDGSDQMASVIVVSAAFGELTGTELARSATLVFIAIQAALAYATAGFLKAPKRGWRDGTFVLNVLRTGSFGNRAILARFERQPFLASMFGMGVAFGDSVIAFAPVAPPQVCVLLLAYGAALHFGIALVLGLNIFVWSFVGTYPAIYWVSQLLYG